MPTVLVIEDEQDMLQIIVKGLEGDGLTVLAAIDGIEGMQLAHEYLPDLIVCDVMLPEVDGFQIFRQLQNDSNTAHIPVIFLTAKNTRDDIRFGMELGADDYITKPFTMRELQRAVRIRLNKHLLDQNSQLRQHARNLMRLHETRQRHLSTRLRQEALQQLAELSLHLNTNTRLSTLDLADLLANARHRVGIIMNDIQEIAYELDPLFLNQFGFVATIAWLIEHSIALRIEFRHTGLDRDIPRPVQEGVFRVVQEALRNISQHAGVEYADLKIWAEDDVLYGQISDEGAGFDYLEAIQQEHTSGLLMINEQIKALEGRLFIQAAPGQGTYMAFSVPLIAQQAPPRSVAPPMQLPDFLVEAEQAAPGMDTAISVCILTQRPFLQFKLWNMLQVDDRFSVVDFGEHLPSPATVTIVDIATIDLEAAIPRDLAETKILVVAPYRDEVFALDMFARGAQGYVLEDYAPDEIILAVNTLAQGGYFLSEVLSKNAVAFYVHLHKPDPSLNVYDTLTMREKEIFTYIARGEQNAQIAERLVLSPRTIETHRSNIMRKLGLNNYTELVLFALKKNIITLND